MCVMSSTFSAVPDWSPLVSVYSRSRDGGSPTSVTSRLGVGVRSGKLRRHAASTSVQAAGGIEPEPRRAAPARADAALCGRCAGTVAGFCGTNGEPGALDRACARMARNLPAAESGHRFDQGDAAGTASAADSGLGAPRAARRANTVQIRRSVSLLGAYAEHGATDELEPIDGNRRYQI
jgi:hypothetical protein